MQPRFLFVCLALIFTLTHATLSNAAASFPENLPRFSCELKPLTRDGLNTAIANRERFAKACLACIGDACAMRIWPEGYEDRETLCRNTYCLPKKIQKMTFAEGYNMSFLYQYEISPNGEATVLEGTYLEGEPKGVTGNRTRDEHRKLMEKFVSRIKYEPIVIDGRRKSLINLETVFEMGANYER